MAAQTPMGPGAKFVLQVDPTGGLPGVSLDDGNGNVTYIAECSPTATSDQFEWLVNAAAAFHHIPVEKFVI